MRSTNSQASQPLSPREGPPGSHLARRRGSDARFPAPLGQRRDESGPPTKPSIAPPSPRPLPRGSALADSSPLLQLERAAPTLTYRLVIALAGAALGLGATMAFWAATRQGGTWLGGALSFLAVSTLIFSASMAVVVTRSFTQRLRQLADAAWQLARQGMGPAAPPSGDSLAVLAHGITRLYDRVGELLTELEQRIEREQARVDELVRERTRALAREVEDYRRMLGEAKGLLTLDRDGRVVAQSPVLEAWLGAMPPSVPVWDYFERAAHGAGSRFQSAWARAVEPRAADPDLGAMPTSLVVGERHFALAYERVLDGRGQLDRVLVLVTDVSIPAPDPATTTRAPE